LVYDFRYVVTRSILTLSISRSPKLPSFNAFRYIMMVSMFTLLTKGMPVALPGPETNPAPLIVTSKVFASRSAMTSMVVSPPGLEPVSPLTTAT